MPFTYVVYICSDISLSKGHLGSREGGVEASKNKLKDANFNFPMTNVMVFSIFLKHAQKEDIELFDLKTMSILKISALYFLKIVVHSLKVLTKQYTVKRQKIRGKAENAFLISSCKKRNLKPSMLILLPKYA